MKQSQNKTHGLSGHPIYRVWSTIKTRCYNNNYAQFRYYGGRGINICDEWFDTPKEFIKWAKNNGWQKGLSIDRINNDGNYEPSNCRFVTNYVNQKNKRSNRFTWKQIDKIRYQFDKYGAPYTHFADIYEVSPVTIRKIIMNKIWVI